MNINTNNRKLSDYQLITLGIELAHSIFAMSECDGNVTNNVHYQRAKELASKWNDTFINMYVCKESA